MNYATIEKELLAVELSFDKFHFYLIGLKVIVYTDHSALKYLLAKNDAIMRLLRWILLLQKFNFEIKDKKSRKNLLANHYSWIEPKDRDDEPLKLINEILLDEYLMSIHTVLWYANIVNYFVQKFYLLG